MIVEDFGDVFLKTLNCPRKIYYFGFFFRLAIKVAESLS